MNRSVERTRLPVSGVGPGEVIVATGFAHPLRGWVRCPAASLLTASLSDMDREMRRSEMRQPGDAVLSAVSWIDRDGCPTGFGVAARADDPTAWRAAADVVDMWSAVLRTRRVMIADSDSDTPWPITAATLARTREFVARGDTVVLIGRPCHAIGHDSGSTVLVESATDVDALTIADPGRLSFVVVPGIPVEDAAITLAALRTRFPRLRGQHPDEFCYDASDRRETLRSVASASDLLLICEPDAEQLAWTARFPTRELNDIGDIRPGWLNSVSTVGLAAGSSARRDLLDDVVAALRGLGPLSVARRRVSTAVDAQPAQPWPVPDQPRLTAAG